jgi:hypothetical protein
MNKRPKSKSEITINYIDLAIQSLFLLIVVFFLINPPEIQIGSELNNPKINNFSDFIQELMIRGSLSLFFIMLSTSISVIFMILPLIFWWIYQLITAFLIGLIFKNTYYWVYALVFSLLIVGVFLLPVSSIPAFLQTSILIIFFVFPFLYYLNRLYVAFWVR